MTDSEDLEPDNISDDSPLDVEENNYLKQG